MRTLLVGCGDHGGNTLLPAACSAGITVAALVDTDIARARELAALWMIPQVYARVEDVDAATFDAAVIALPVAAQADHAHWAVDNGLHTFVEKPPAPDPARLRTLVDHARRAAVVCCVGMNFRWAQGVRRLWSALESGQYGHVASARVEHIAHKPVRPFGTELSMEASLFAAQGIHAIDLGLLLLPGRPAFTGQMVDVARGRLCSLVGEDTRAGTRLEVQFGSCAAGFYHHVQVVTSCGDILQLRNLSELVHLPNGGDPHVAEYPGARVLWRGSPIGGGYEPAGYGPELAAFRARRHGPAPAHLATAADLLPVYDAFDTVLGAGGLKWTA